MNQGVLSSYQEAQLAPGADVGIYLVPQTRPRYILNPDPPVPHQEAEEGFYPLGGL